MSAYGTICTMYEVLPFYQHHINNRIVSYMEDKGLYAGEQNGFRKDRSCSEHIFSITFIIRNRKQQGKPTYTAFLDAEKAFDREDRDLLLYKLLNIGIKGIYMKTLILFIKKQLVLLM